MLTVRQVGSFVTDVNERFTQPPFKGTLPFAPKPLFIRDWTAGRIDGFLTTISLHGRFRRAENKLARSIGYPIRRLPYVPLQGLVVRANPKRVLEVYENPMVFRTPAAARAWIRSSFFQVGPRLVGLPHLGDETVGYRLAFGRSDNYERELVIFVRLGDLGLKVATQGGVHVPLTAAVRLARIATRDITTACPGI